MADIPEKYILFNDQLTKNISVIVKIAGVPDLLSNRPIYTTIRYGDPHINYGDPDLVYGGLRRRDDVKDYLSLDGSSMIISQMIEPEKGKGSVSQFSLSFVDVNGYMTNLISPGAVIPDILGAQVSIFLGYEQISYPEDFFQVFRGYVTKVNSKSGMVTLGISDPSVKRRTTLFYTPSVNLTAPIPDAVATTINLNTGDFNQKILGPNGTYDPAITLYIQVGDEVIDYTAAIVTPTQMIGVTRGARGTIAIAHASTEQVQSRVQIADAAITMALKLMLSGWDGYFQSDVPLSSIYYSLDVTIGSVPGGYALGSNVDAVRDYNLSVGDYVTVTGASNSPNNVTLAKVIRFQDVLGESNRMIVTDNLATVLENTTSALIAFRSQFDTYPTNCGLRMSPPDVDVERHLYEQRTFLNAPNCSYRFYITDQKDGKDFIESQIYLPMGAYAITRFGLLSVGLTKPPLADQNLIILSIDNLKNVENITPERSATNRKFYNIISYDFDFDDQGNPTTSLRKIDSDSVNIIGLSGTLPVVAEGARSDLGAASLFDKRSQLMLTRFRNGAVYFDVEPLWTQANQIQSGDVVVVKDNGKLQLSNFATGGRDLGVQLYEVVNRQLDAKTGSAKLSLVNGVGAEATDRFGTIGPSSLTTTGSTTTRLKFVDSFGAVFPGNEQKKWTTYIGELVRVHANDWSFSEEVTLIGFDPFDRYTMIVDPPLSVPPPAGYVIDQPYYSDSADPTVNQLFKLINDSWSPRVTITSGTSVTQFDVGAGDIGKFFVDGFVSVHNDDFTMLSPDRVITDITGTTITVGATLNFVPASGYKVDLIGFPDHGSSYRWI